MKSKSSLEDPEIVLKAVCHMKDVGDIPSHLTNLAYADSNQNVSECPVIGAGVARSVKVSWYGMVDTFLGSAVAIQ
ncbi:hypothetical protein JTE90_026786 [Oedothorax gibbosus]|uniref:Uncharacterized protein n=1 Tax=Oedothorax gibbosus TaxID=931172 RepID=A0AAV6UPJ1_9ARAC|nr:hypothetical protein JTE90_026786 [Oedothorax gibbosus]